jgi:hypothetical protein
MSVSEIKNGFKFLILNNKKMTQFNKRKYISVNCGLGQKHLEILKCDAGEGWNRSVGPIMREMKKYY